MLSRFINYHTSRLTAVAFLSNGYFPPPAKLDASAVDGVNKATLTSLGYEALGFWPFFNEADASALLDEHVQTKSFQCHYRPWYPKRVARVLLQSHVYTQHFVLENGLCTRRCTPGMVRTRRDCIRRLHQRHRDAAVEEHHDSSRRL